MSNPAQTQSALHSNSAEKSAEVKLGQRNAREAEVLEGLVSGETVIRHPANQVAEGVKVRVD